jgi:hypothetical protein
LNGRWQYLPRPCAPADRANLLHHVGIVAKQAEISGHRDLLGALEAVLFLQPFPIGKTEADREGFLLEIGNRFDVRARMIDERVGDVVHRNEHGADRRAAQPRKQDVSLNHS